MKQKSYEGTTPKIRKIRTSLNTPTVEGVFLARDCDGCMLVVPEVFEMREHITLYRGRSHKHQL